MEARAHKLSPQTLWSIVVGALFFTTLFSFFTIQHGSFFTFIVPPRLDCAALPKTYSEVKVEAWVVRNEAEDPAPMGARVKLSYDQGDQGTRPISCARVWIGETELKYVEAGSFLAGDWSENDVGVPDIQVEAADFLRLRVDVGVDGEDDIRGIVQSVVPRDVSVSFENLEQPQIEFQDAVADLTNVLYKAIVTDNPEIADRENGHYAEFEESGKTQVTLNTPPMFRLPQSHNYFFWVAAQNNGEVLGTFDPESFFRAIGYSPVISHPSPYSND